MLARLRLDGVEIVKLLCYLTEERVAVGQCSVKLHSPHLIMGSLFAISTAIQLSVGHLVT